MPYQDVWVQGKVVTTGSRHKEEERYEVFKTIADQFKRPFSVLDIGANQGYFGFRMAEDYDATVVMVEGQRALIDNCRANKAPKVIGLKKRLKVTDLETWSQAEHFDIVLCLNMIHHFKKDWRRAADAVLQFGSHIIIETPAHNETAVFNPDGSHDLLRYLKSMPHTKIGSAASFASKKVIRPIYLFEREKTRLGISYHKPSRKHEAKPNKHVIDSTYRSKRIRIPVKGDDHKWIHGMNLQNFILFGGAYPGKKRIIRMVREEVERATADRRHGDIRPWNFILCGDRVRLIDWTDKRNVHQDDEGLEKTIAMIERQMK